MPARLVESEGAIESNLHSTLKQAVTNNIKAPGTPNGHKPKLDDDEYAVLALRNLIFDICNQNGGGHGGSAIGMSAIGIALFRHVMRYNPTDPSWFDRDKFVLSNGITTPAIIPL